MQSHIIFGAGLIGGFLGGVLTSLNINTTLVCRPSVRQKLSNGIKLTDYLGNEKKVKTLHFLTEKDGLKEPNKEHFCDFLWITVKCTGIDQASKDISPLVGPNTIIFCCQNGLGSEKVIQRQYPNHTVLRVMVPFNVSEPSPGHLHRGSEGTLYIETTTQLNELICPLVLRLTTPIMPVAQTTKMQELLWAKLQLNLGNSINALADIPVKKMLQQREYRLVIAALMKELLSVTKALNIKLPKLTAVPAQLIPTVLGLPNFLFTIVANKMLAIDPTVRTSMWWDLSQGKTTEIEYLNGAIVNIAEELKINCFANQKIISLIKQIEQTNEQKTPRKVISGKELLHEIKKGNH
ncbi:2-dehydropantoate 2-reductase [Aquimarina sp. 2304DJ70-9]|uniref:2-dehydropantoate 2-reductase n=1 Tax=Aquimarina penaris TaxID=3231044 RepID=UPI003462BC89